MGLWSRLFRWWGGAPADAGAEPLGAEAVPPESEPRDNTVQLPTEPYVFECQSCGKVFEARRRRAQCPECDSREVSLVSE